MADQPLIDPSSQESDPGAPQSGAAVADAKPGNWVDRWAPLGARPYLRLARLDRPAGTWLVLLPCWWGVALAVATGAVASERAFYPDPYFLVLFAIGAIAMRGAGCTFNDIVDRDFDARVERTRNRPIASGAISVPKAVLFLVLQSLVGLAVLIQFNAFTIWLGVASLALVVIYPFAKRFTYWPQFFLGLAFNWGALMGWSAVTGSLSMAPVILYAAGIAWTLGYDTIYAHQDKEDDALIGVKSLALKLGASTKPWLMLFYGALIAGLGAAGNTAGMGWVFYALLLGPAAHLAYQVARLDVDDPAVCLRIFRENRDFGLLVFAVIVVGAALSG